MDNKNQLNEDQLEKVSGGSNFEIGKFYCYGDAAKDVTGGTVGTSCRLGPYDALSKATAAGLEWAIACYNAGYYDITYTTEKWDYGGWILYRKYNYPE